MSFLGYVQSLWGSSSASFTGTSRGGSDPSAQRMGSGIWPLSAQVREEMKKGIRYNMKVVLRGTQATGKSTLLALLTGHPLPTRYIPSTELAASTMRLQGEHCLPHEGTKVDIWEVVEEGRHRSTLTSSANTDSKMGVRIPTAQLHEALRMAADAQSLDTYAGCHLVIFMIDPCQRISWEYAKRETLQVPPTSCILYALNFSDVISLKKENAAVTLDEVQSWCNRVRRATTTTMLRLLEGRQAPPEFSVRPMTAVLSAQMGTGIMGVVRALHVASTLVRITAEEARVQELLGLLARQQALSIASDDAAPATPPGEELVGGAVAHPSQVPRGSQPHESIAIRLHSVKTSTPPPCNRFETSSLMTTAHSSVRDTGPASSGTAVRTKPGVVSVSQSESGGLRLQHHLSAPTRSIDHEASFPNGNGKGTQPSQRLPRRSTGDADAMRLFFGSSDSAASLDSSARSSKSSHASGAANRTFPGSEKRRAGAPLLSIPNASQSAVHSTPECHGKNPSGAPAASGCDLGVAPPPLSEERSTPMLVTPQPVRHPPGELVGTWVSDMVQDTSVPVDSFFGGDDDDDLVCSVASECSPPTPYSTVGRLSGAGSRTARVLETQRVVQRVKMTAPPPTEAAASELDADVATILAQMTAALTADVPSATAETAPDIEVARYDASIDPVKRIATSQRGKDKHRHTALSNHDGRRQHHRRKKHSGSAKGSAIPPLPEAREEVNNDSFALHLV